MKSAAGLCSSTLVSRTKFFRPSASLIGGRSYRPREPPHTLYALVNTHYVALNALPAQIQAAAFGENVGRAQAGVAAEEKTASGEADWRVVGAVRFSLGGDRQIEQLGELGGE